MTSSCSIWFAPRLSQSWPNDASFLDFLLFLAFSSALLGCDFQPQLLMIRHIKPCIYLSSEMVQVGNDPSNILGNFSLSPDLVLVHQGKLWVIQPQRESLGSHGFHDKKGTIIWLAVREEKAGRTRIVNMYPCRESTRATAIQGICKYSGRGYRLQARLSDSMDESLLRQLQER